MADQTTETKAATPAAKPEMKSFEEAATEFMKQAAANEYGGEDDDAAPTIQTQPTPEKKEAAAAPKAEEKKPDAAAPRRAPDAVFQKPEEKKPDDKAVESELDKIQKPEFKDPSKASQWDQLHAKAKTYEKEVGEHKAKINELNGRLGHLAKLENQIKERDAKIAEMSALVERANVEAHPEFRKKYVDGRESLVGRAKQIVSDAGGEGDEIGIALSLQGKARVEAIEKAAEGLSTFQQGRLAKVIDELEILDHEASEKRSKSGDAWKEIQKEQQERAEREQQEFNAKFIKTHEAVKRDMAREHAVLKEAEGEEWWNEQRKGILERADKFVMENDDPRESSKAAVWKEMGPVYEQLYSDEREHSKKIEAELAEAKKALEEAYGSGPRATARIGDDGKKTVKNMTFEERVEYETSQER